MFEQFKSVNAESAEVDELVALVTFGKSFRAEFEAQKVPVPDYVNDNLNTLTREINSRMADKRAARAREIKAQLSSLQSREEKKTALEQELAALEQA